MLTASMMNRLQKKGAVKAQELQARVAQDNVAKPVESVKRPKLAILQVHGEA